MWNFELVPEQASTIAHRVDVLYFVLIALSGLIALGVTGALVYFSVKYRHRAPADELPVQERSDAGRPVGGQVVLHRLHREGDG